MAQENPKMVYRSLGKCGTKVSALSLGGWTTYGASVHEAETVKKILYAAYEAGINFFDIADIYAKGESERMMGAVLKEFPRHQLVLSSKVYWPMSEEINDRGLSRKHIFESVEKSLKRMGTDYLDLYFCHRYDDETPLEETVRAMDDLVHQGKVLYWGTSEWSGAQLEAVQKLCGEKNYYSPQVEQPQYSLLARKRVESEVLPVVQKSGMGMVVWSPLASGVLTGKYDQGLPKEARLAKIDWLREALLTEENLKSVRAFKKLSDETGYSRTQLALAWLLHQEGVSSVITGATRLEQLNENLGALRVNLSSEIQKQIADLFSNY